jgi:molybdopterin-guanine dinucleotide biosynthesis protein A
MSKHQKHTKLPLRKTGNYAPNEIALVGTKCSEVKSLVKAIANALGNTYKLAFLDASHDASQTPVLFDDFTYHANGNVTINAKQKADKLSLQRQLAPYDLSFINGNHYQGSQQILILDKAKEASVKKRLDQLNNIQFIIKLTPDAPLFDFVETAYPDVKNLPVYDASNIEAISQHIKQLIDNQIPPVQGLVLAGGKSIRMGTDKGQLNYYGKPQREYIKDLLEAEGLTTYYSVRADQNFEDQTPTITDRFLNLGAFGAIASAFQSNPNRAWLVLATDLPFVNQDLIKLLIQRRNPSKIATAVKGKNKPFPEPLIAIWEPKAYPEMLSFLALGYSCPRKVLINSEVEIVEVDDALIRNINTPEEFEAAKKDLNQI